MTTQEALGRIFDISPMFAPVDIDTANGWTGLKINLRKYGGVTCVFFGKAGGADDMTLDCQQSTAYTGGTTNDMDSANSAVGITSYWIKAETTLDGDEAWVNVTQTEASEVVVVGATYGAMQKIVVFDVQATQLADGYSWFSVVGSLTTSTAQISAGLYLLHDLRYQRVPSKLGNILNPGAANA